jgi:hypothetical protein
MPAIQLTRLKKQLAELRQDWPDAQAFYRGILKLLELYADHSLRTGQAAEPSPILFTYQVPPPLIREIVVEFDDVAASQPMHTLQICDLLWNDASYEPRLLAIRFLGVLPSLPGEVATRAARWMDVTTDEQLIHAMFRYGLANFAEADPAAFLLLVENWLASSRVETQALGLRAIVTLLAVPGFHNYPPCFRLLTPLVRQPPPYLRPELVRVLRQLGEESPLEAAYFFLDILEGSISAQTPILIRQSITPLPVEQARRIRQTLRERERRFD